MRPIRITFDAFRGFVTFVASFAVIVSGWDCPAAAQPRKPAAYDFRSSERYRELDATSRERLEKVVADFAVLEQALNAFMEDHQGAPPKTLTELVPEYVDELPVDPFAQKGVAIPDRLEHFNRSLDGRGYLYLQKPQGRLVRSGKRLEWQPSPGAWNIRSVGLPTFPLRYSVSNPGLIRTRGYWGRLLLDVF